MNIDFVKLQAEAGPKTILLGNQFANSQTETASGTGSSFTGLSSVSSVFVEATVYLRQSFRGTPGLSLVVEHSDNGSVWVTANTFSFSTDGTDSATISSPKEHMRVRWVVSGGSEWSIVSVTVASIASNGGSLPAGQVGVQALGPYTFDYTHADVNVQEFFVPGGADIPDGFWIFNTLVELTTQWKEAATAPGLSYRLGVSPSDEVTNIEIINFLDFNGVGGNIMDDAGGGSNVPLLVQKRTFRLDLAGWGAENARTLPGARLSISIYSMNGDPFVSGAMRIWALGVQT